MIKIKRFSIKIDSSIKEHKRGNYVLYTDHKDREEKLIDLVEYYKFRLTKMNKHHREEIEQIQESFRNMYKK